jgi:BirA family transcriptional regulator, biotin operon repressor / biotin---[acetyl-CoA-carboxylase] ligase
VAQAAERLRAAGGERLLHLPTVDSTMEEARRLWSRGEVAGRVWIVADAQSGGRGRQGRAWWSPPGNLYATLLLPAPCPPRDQPKLGFVAGVALQAAVGGASRLKWPNDLLIGGAKAAGLLLEGLGGGAAVAIGMGVNITSHPPDTPYAATDLQAHDGGATRDALFARLTAAMAEALDVFAGVGGFGAIRRRWLAAAAFLGERIEVRREEGPLAGTFAAIDEDGRLVLATAEGEVRISAGDVFPLDKRSASAHDAVASGGRDCGRNAATGQYGTDD